MIETRDLFDYIGMKMSYEHTDGYTYVGKFCHIPPQIVAEYGRISLDGTSIYPVWSKDIFLIAFPNGDTMILPDKIDIDKIETI